jgi:L-rhamnose-H+ transport protein
MNLLLGMLLVMAGGALEGLFSLGHELKESALRAGASPVAQNNAIWALVFTGNYLVNFLYALYLLVKNKSFGQFAQGTGSHWLWALFLGTAWPLGIVLFGIGADRMGAFGGYAGFPLLLVFAIVFSNLAGALTGEWRGTRPATRQVMLGGVLILLSATILFAWANRIETTSQPAASRVDAARRTAA